MSNKYKIITFGCQMNKSDSERIAAVLEQAGFIMADKEKSANIIVINACSVRQSAMDRIYGKIKKWQALKEDHPVQLILTGCVLEEDKKKLINNFDLVVSVDDFANKFKELDLKDYFSIHPQYESSFQAYVPIMTGCNNFCAYCVVPYVRGRERSRPVKDILEEVKDLIDKGYKEITLLGQNVNSYQGDNQIDFPALLKLVNDIAGDFWIRFITSHPKDMSDKLITTMAELDKICEYVHLPAQSGDNHILEKMNRGYTIEHYIDLIKKIRKQAPEVAISTDVIVGFPGETEEQFEQTVKLFKEIKYDMAYILKYSERNGTAAAKLKDDVPKTEKKKREKALTEILKQTALENNKKLIGKELTILVEKENLGITRGFKNVKIKADKGLIGQFVQVKIAKADVWGLLGEIIK